MEYHRYFWFSKEGKKQIGFIVWNCMLAFILLSGNKLYAQSSIAINGGFSQSIFYCSQAKSTYRYSFTPYNSYLINITYKENLSSFKKNLQVGAQLEFKQQSAQFYYQDLFASDTFATRVRYDIRSLNLYFFPELKVGEKIKFILSGGPLLQYIVNTKATGIKLQVQTGSPNIETIIDTKHTDAIAGFVFGAKVNLGIEIPLYKNLYLTYYNSYTAGFTGMQGTLRKQMKYFNCLDINISGGLLYRIEHKKT
jgi:hypothetical protein